MAKFVKRVALGIGFFISVSVTGHKVFAENLEADALTLEHQHLVMIASYVGSAYFCVAYGVDYLAISERLERDVQTKIIAESDPLYEILWRRGKARGEIGELFSPQIGQFVSLVAAADTKKACDGAYVAVLKISKIK